MTFSKEGSGGGGGGGGGGLYLDCFFQLRNLADKNFNTKPSYFIEIHRSIGILLHILAHHAPKLGQIFLKLAIYIVCSIFLKNEVGQRSFCCPLLAILELEGKRGNAKQSYLIETYKEIRTLFHILRNSGIVLKFVVYKVYNICKRMEWEPEAVILTASSCLGASAANVVITNHRIWYK